MDHRTVSAPDQSSVIEHSPLPWRVDRRALTRVVSNVDDTVAATACQSDLQDCWEANAAFIVRACNSFDELVKALEEIVAIEDRPRGDDWCEINEARDIARAALAKAKGQ